jgi:carbonic anhydrase/SulP family sulfate permease
MAFQQPDDHNTFSEIATLFSGEVHQGAVIVGLASIVLLVWWDKSKLLKKCVVPGPLVVVLLGCGLAEYLRTWKGEWVIGSTHLVAVPVASSVESFLGFFRQPDFTQIVNPAVWVAGITIALVASLETLLNLEAVDKLDKLKRQSPPSRELFAQGVGNMVAGLIGAIPITSVIVRSSVNVNTGARTKASTVTHGILLLVALALFPTWMNRIPLAALAAILIVTGFKLASPKVFKEMYHEGRYQFLPFFATVTAIVMTDLLIGVMIGLAISVSFILYSNLRRPIRKIVEHHISGDVLRIELASQVSFLNRVALERVLMDVPRGGNVLIDARNTVFIDPDATYFLHDFVKNVAPAHGVNVSLVGFKDSYVLDDRTVYVDYCSRELQETMTPHQVIEILRAGNERFRTGRQLTRDVVRQLSAASDGQHPLAVVLSCIDSRNPTEIIFDLGVGDIFSTRIAGNTISPKVLGSMEYGCAVAGAKLVLVMGHTRCGAVTEAVVRLTSPISPRTSICTHLTDVVEDIQLAVSDEQRRRLPLADAAEREAIINEVARRNVEQVLDAIVDRSDILRQLVEKGRIAIAGGLYDVTTGCVDIFPHCARQFDAALS